MLRRDGFLFFVNAGFYIVLSEVGLNPVLFKFFVIILMIGMVVCLVAIEHTFSSGNVIDIKGLRLGNIYGIITGSIFFGGLKGSFTYGEPVDTWYLITFFIVQFLAGAKLNISKNSTRSDDSR